jgi:pimeloyl-ACP methyl ester carboxylesterase
MRRLLPLLAVGALAIAPAADAKVRQGPAGNAFYTPPPKLPGKAHGDPIWARKLSGEAVLKGARSNTLVLYRSNSTNGGDAIAVSGTLAVPRGKPPRGGWPVLTWGHGTKGLADACTPSKGYGGFASETALLQAWLKRGYAVVRTDYEGLGTPGVHPFLIGRSEARSMLDMVRAARKVNRRIGKRVVIAGESQGGQAALWAAAEAPKWTRELNVRGTLAFAPVSQLRQQGELFVQLETAPPNLPAYAAMIMRGIDTADPRLQIATLLTDRTSPLYPFVDAECGSRLDDEDRFGSVAPNQFFRSDADLTPAFAALEANDAGNLKLRQPVHIAQGTADQTVFKAFTDELVEELRAAGAKVTYKLYEGAGHGSDLLATRGVSRDALAFSRRRAGR